MGRWLTILPQAEDGAEEDAQDSPGEPRNEGEQVADRHRHGEQKLRALGLKPEGEE